MYEIHNIIKKEGDINNKDEIYKDKDNRELVFYIV